MSEPGFWDNPERARQIGARCQIESEAGAGTTVILQLPAVPETHAGLGNGSRPAHVS